MTLISIKLGFFLSDLVDKYFESPFLLRVMRAAKVGHVFRLLDGTKGIRTLLVALVMSIPALFNICLLLVVVSCTFAFSGMSLFVNFDITRDTEDLHDFNTFGHSFIAVLQVSSYIYFLPNNNGIFYTNQLPTSADVEINRLGRSLGQHYK